MVDGGGLENHCTRKGTGGSNPSPSANLFDITIMRNALLVSILALAVVGTALAQPDQALTRQRAKIDALDARIVALLNERAQVVREIGRVKQHAGLAVTDPKRVEEVLQRIASNNRGPLPKKICAGSTSGLSRR